MHFKQAFDAHIRSKIAYQLYYIVSMDAKYNKSAKAVPNEPTQTKNIFSFLWSDDFRDVLFEFHLKFWNTARVSIPSRSLLF